MASRFAPLRFVTRAPGLAFTAIATLALGIGAATTMFSVVDAALWRPVPFADPDRLVVLYQTRVTAADGAQRMRWSYPHYTALQRTATSFESVATFTSAISLALGGSEYAEPINGEVVAPPYFSALGITPIAGRTFRTDEDSIDAAHPVAMISASLWRRRFNADERVLNSTIRVHDVALTVIGVLPDGFSGLSGRLSRKADIWIPTSMAPMMTYSEYRTTPQHFISVVGRLRAGVTLDQANAELAAIGPSLGDASTTPATWSAVAVPLGDARVDATVRRSTLLLFWSAVLLLLTTCVNVASLLLARAATRGREMAIRKALGASRGRLVRQLLTEGLVLAAMAGTAGLILAAWGVAFYGKATPGVIAFWGNDYSAVTTFATAALDLRTVLFAMAVTLSTTLVFALAPALNASAARPAVAMQADQRAGGGSRRSLSSFVIAEIALAVLLLSMAGLLGQNFARVERMRTGYTPENVLTFSVRPPNTRYKPEDGPAILERLLTRIESVPGVQRAALNRCAPFGGCARTTLFFADRPNDAKQAPVVGRHYVSADYFTTLGIPLLAGRAIAASDRAGGAPVAVVNESAARRYWPDKPAVGQHVWFGSVFTEASRPVEIVGVVGDVKYEGADQRPAADFYTSYLQFAYPDSMFLVKVTPSSASLAPALRAAVTSVDPQVPVDDVRMLDERISLEIARPRFNAALVTGGAAAALLLAALGVYGLLSYAVSVRRREMGIRLALGSTRGGLIRLVIREGLQLAVLGAVVGLVAALGAGRLLQSLVPDVQTSDLLILSIVTVLMLLVAAAAAFVPAARASAVDPSVAFRNE